MVLQCIAFHLNRATQSLSVQGEMMCVRNLNMLYTVLFMLNGSRVGFNSFPITKKAINFQRTLFEKKFGSQDPMLGKHNSSLASGRTQEFWTWDPIILEQLGPGTTCRQNLMPTLIYRP